MPYLIEAIVCDPSGHVLDGDYYKIVYRSDDNAVEPHQDNLERQGYRVLSIKSRQATSVDIDELSDLQGNQLVVDGKVVHPGESNG